MPSSLRDRLGGDRVVAGDHAHLDAGLVRGRDRGLGGGARRVDDADQREQREPVHQRQQVGRRVEAAASKSLRAVAMTRRPFLASRSFSSR